jgi:flagellin-like protein
LRNITKIKRSIRAISPVISVLLMIAIAVVAALVAYAWVMGYMGNQTGKTDNSIAIQSYSFDGNLTVYVQNTGQGLVNLKQDSSVYVNDVLYSILEADDVVKGNGALIPISAGQTVKVEVDYYNYKVGDKIKIVTYEGTWMEVTATNPPAGTPAPVTKYIITPSAGEGGSISPSTAQQVAAGGSITFNIAANQGYHIKDVTVDGVSQGARTSYPFTNVQTNHQIVATFEADGAATSYTITPTAGTGGTISPNTAQTVAAGGSITFNIAANQGYHIKDVTVDGNSIGAVTTKQFTNVQANHVLEAIFEQDTVNPTKFTVTPSAGTGGSISPNTPQEVASGGSITFTAQPNQGYHVKNWLVDGTSQGSVATSFTLTNIQESHQIQVTFEADTPQKYTVTFTQTGLDSSVGTTKVLTVNGAAKTLADFPVSIQVNVGESVTYSYESTISAGSEKQFVITNTPSPASPVTSTATVNAQYNTQYQITFALNIPEAGTTTPATGTSWQNQGELAISATANTGYTFDSWTTSTVSISIDSQTSATINGAGTITANFETSTATVLDSRFDDSQTWDAGWDDWDNPPWFWTTDPDNSNEHCAGSDGYSENRGAFTSNEIPEVAEATAIHISFRYRTYLPLDGSLGLYYTGINDPDDGPSPNDDFNEIIELPGTDGEWESYSVTLYKTTDSEAFTEYFRLRFESFITTFGWGSWRIVEQVWVDDVVISIDRA